MVATISRTVPEFGSVVALIGSSVPVTNRAVAPVYRAPSRSVVTARFALSHIQPPHTKRVSHVSESYVGRPRKAHTIDATKVYSAGQTEVRALNGVTVGFESRRFTAIMGAVWVGKIHASAVHRRSGFVGFRTGLSSATST